MYDTSAITPKSPNFFMSNFILSVALPVVSAIALINKESPNLEKIYIYNEEHLLKDSIRSASYLRFRNSSQGLLSTHLYPILFLRMLVPVC